MAEINDDSPDRVEVAVVGGGQAGLAIGHFLSAQGRRFVILEAADTLGAAWKQRWASLVLFTPRRYDGLPGLAFPGDPDGYPGRDEVVSYLEAYAAEFALPVEFGSGVWSMAWADGHFVLEVDDRTLEADAVVVATGPFQTPRMPRFAADLAPAVFQVHSAGYSGPGEVPAGTVLVVGGGNTGFQIASELADTHTVHLSIGSRQRALPQRLLGRDLFWWLTKTGRISARRMGARDALVGTSRRALRRRGVSIRARATGAAARAVTFADGSELAVDAVVWASGFGLDHSWIDLPVTTTDGALRQRRGVAETPGLYFLGMPWQSTRGSALLGWVKDDAEYIAAKIAGQFESDGSTAMDTPPPSDHADEPESLAVARRALAGTERDQVAARRDHAADERDLLGEQRDDAGEQRDRAAGERDAADAERDQAGASRDQAAIERDALAEQRDRAEAKGKVIGSAADALIRSALARRDAAWDRRQALHDREAGARGRAEAEHDRDAGASERVEAEHDRDAGASERIEAGHDRTTAFTDRGVAAKERRFSSVDELTGSYRRDAGFTELEREIGRARRMGTPLTVVSVDVDGADDGRLVNVADTIAAAFRPYDPVIRNGERDFLCAVSGLDEAGAANRIAVIRAALEQAHDLGRVSTGVAALQPGDSCADVVERADLART